MGPIQLLLFGTRLLIADLKAGPTPILSELLRHVLLVFAKEFVNRSTDKPRTRDIPILGSFLEGITLRRRERNGKLLRIFSFSHFKNFHKYLIK
ncbi:hypothetical protein Q669_00475 [Labrenzia sp. C1B10]|nr:hypothetical protein Q669_00475 [Labrenzia sp. C1B10]ERS00965.1 hypothetical protein Q675_09165 [Labrenzia sp. C1B70]